MTDLKVEVAGLAAINRALRAVDKEAPKQLRLVLNDAAELLVTEVRPEIPEVSGASRRSVVARSTRTSARVAVGGKKAPWYPWLDFGGEGKVKGRPVHREFIREGRYVYPTLRRIRPRIMTRLGQGLAGLAADAGLDVT